MTPHSRELADRLERLRIVLKSGEYDGADLMAAWCAMSEAAALLRREPSVEEVARAIDPGAFGHLTVHPQHLARRRKDAVGKAQAVAALRGRGFSSSAKTPIPTEPEAADSGSRRDE